MKSTQKIEMNPKTPSRPIKVTFIPVREDYIYVSRAITSSISNSRPTNYLYRAFLILNAVCFPAYLIFTGYPIAGLSIFAANVIIFLFLVPLGERKKDEKFYDKLYKDIGDHPVEIELTAEGISVRSDGDDGLIAWKNISNIQESRETVYFFATSTGMPVRKSAFESEEQQAEFMDTARYYHRFSKAEQLEKQPVSAISS